MKLTFVDTPSHGYLKVSKNFFIGSGFDVNEISKYSGMSSNFVYLEEDCDAYKFIDYLQTTNGMEVELETVHRNRNNVPSHNYNPKILN